MAPLEKTQYDLLVYYALAVAILFLILTGYGRQAIEWMVLKLYEFFIQRHPMK